LKHFGCRPVFRSGKGFTLLEIILAVGIGVIFMGGAVVLLSTTFDDPKIRKTSDLLREAARTARERALTEGARQVVRLGADHVNDQLIPEGVRIDFWRPGFQKNDWRIPQDVRWEFTGGGLVEPIRLKLVHGENVEILEFNALTGEARRELSPAP
jgi:prepilin-type N-terminal cleavage/methylation domain-containing protein